MLLRHSPRLRSKGVAAGPEHAPLATWPFLEKDFAVPGLKKRGHVNRVDTSIP